MTPAAVPDGQGGLRRRPGPATGFRDARRIPTPPRATRPLRRIKLLREINLLRKIKALREIKLPRKITVLRESGPPGRATPRCIGGC